MEIDVMVQDFCEENVKITWTMDSDIKLQSSEVYNKNENSVASKIVFVPTNGCQKLTVTATNKHGETETRSELIQVNCMKNIIKRTLILLLKMINFAISNATRNQKASGKGNIFQRWPERCSNQNRGRRIATS